MTITSAVLLIFAAYILGQFQGRFEAERDAEQRAIDAKRNPFYGMYKTRYEQDALDAEHPNEKGKA